MTRKNEHKNYIGLYLVFYILSAILLLVIYSQNFADPYTGEMWELAYIAAKDSELINKIQEISSFVCFGAGRFQPIGFFIPYLLIIIAGTNFVLAHILSVGLHILSSLLISFICYKYTKNKNITLVIYVLTLFTFLASDVIIWTFFSYIQISCILIIISLYNYIEYLKKNNYKNLILFYLLAISTTLIYEAGLSVFFIPIIFYICSKANFNKKNQVLLEIIVPILIILSYLLAAYISMNLNFKDSSQTFGLQILVKIASYAVYYFRYSIGITVTPEIHNIGSIYGLSISLSLINIIIIMLVLISTVIILGYLVTNSKAIKLFRFKTEIGILLTANFLYIFIIGYGRVGDDYNFLKPSNLETQFRYYYLTSLLIPLSLGLFASNLNTKYKSVIYTTLIFIIFGNILNILDYGRRISSATNALTLDYYKIANSIRYNKSHEYKNEILKEMHSNWYLEKIDTKNKYQAFTYNANKCKVHLNITKNESLINSNQDKSLIRNFNLDANSFFSKAKLLNMNDYVITSSSQLPGAGAYEAFTGKGIWHVNHIPNPPEKVSAVIDFGQNQRKQIVGISFTPRLEEPNQFWKNLEIRASMDGKVWENIFQVEVFAPPQKEEVIYRFMNKNHFRFYRIDIDSGFKEGRFFSLSKINVYGIDD